MAFGSGVTGESQGNALRIITLLDTAIASTNLGDQIIMEAVRDEIETLAPDAFVYSVATHDRPGRKSRSLIARSDDVIVGGTNLLSSRMWFRPLWKLSPTDMLRRFRVTLLGVGWYQSQAKPDLYSRTLLRRVLAPSGWHSVRDSYTGRMLASTGIPNVVNTGCPTLWNLTPERCARIPPVKAARVITALNTYMPDPTADAALLRLLRRHYTDVYFWPQTASDRAYAADLDPDLLFLEPRLKALDALLESNESLDYVGNRLHAGIRALQRGRRAVIVEIDNRAREMGWDFGLPTVPRPDFERLVAMVRNPLPTRIRLPSAEIELWRTALARGPGPGAPA
ncbi:MAG: polysaccharide pyruvyl transferase family protein [Gemmatimonadota bacterium]